MKIFANVKTGEVVGTVDGFDDELIAGIRIVPSNMDEKDIVEEVIHLGHPKEELARRLMDPRDPLSTMHLKYDGGEVKEMSDKEKKAVDDKLAKQQAEIEKLRQDALNRPSLQQQIDELHSKIDKSNAAAAQGDVFNSKTAPF